MPSPISPPPGGGKNTYGGTQDAKVRFGEVAGPGNGRLDAITPSEGLHTETAPVTGHPEACTDDSTR
uniref:Uncharacterized protein n=1 Tax=Peronospora matthiolae TaxID=2874970 RepID=A0AAV1VKR9_9STRA